MSWPILAFRVDRLEPFATAADVAAQLHLPARNPAAALGAVAGDTPSLLLIDQLDAVSFASGRLPRQLEPITELLEQTKAFPEMRVLLACRQYDLANDPRLGALVAEGGPAHLQTVGALSDQEVDPAVGELGLDPGRLTAEQRALLSSPLHLVLLAATADESAALGFRSSKDLLDAYYARKERDCRSPRAPDRVRFSAVIIRLAETMSAQQRLSLPTAVLDADDLQPDADVLASEQVITFDEGKVAFFHEAFFDYAFARGWAAGGRGLRDWLLDSEQELFRRAQVRQVLAHLRDIDPARFTAELRTCLTDDRVRVHIKDVMFAVLGSLSNPTSADWRLISEMLEGERWESGRAWRALRSEPWFARADEEGAISTWLSSADQAARARGVEIAAAGAAAHGDRVAELLGLLDDREESVNALLWVVRSPALAHSRALFDLVLAAVRTGALSNQPQPLFMDAAHLERDQPGWAVELITAWLAERPEALAVTTMRIGALESREYGLMRLVSGAGAAAPLAFVRALTPYIIAAAKACSYAQDTRPIPDLQFRDHDRQQHPDVGDVLQSTMAAIAAVLE
jgi:hypothetical protein